jgi:hypothetical protein
LSLSGCIERLSDIVNRTHGSHVICCVSAINALVRIADKSSISIRECFVSCGCLALLLQVGHATFVSCIVSARDPSQLLSSIPDSEIAEHVVLVLYHLSTGLPQVFAPADVARRATHTAVSSTRCCGS